MIRKNVESFPHIDPSGLAEGPVAPFLSYRDAPDRALEARYVEDVSPGEACRGDLRGLVSSGRSEISRAGSRWRRAVASPRVRPERMTVKDRYPPLFTSHLIPHRRLS